MRMLARTALPLLLLLALLAAPLVASAGSTPLTTRRIAVGINRPVFVVAPPGDYTRLFVVEQPGVIKIYDMVNATMMPTPFLNISSLVGGGDSGQDERGLLGLAFHPDYANNGFFYVSYTNNGNASTIARYSVSTTNPNVANASSASIILTQSQPAGETNHNGGMIAFSPIDGYLYIGLGDGGGANDQHGATGNAQNPSTRLGKMLRIDVDSGSPFVVPPSNPFVGPGGFLDEIWAYGLRNPWRWSFDRDTGDMYIADVGQGQWEEVDIQLASSTGGENYGWRCKEGNACTGLAGCSCADPTLTDPVQVHSHAGGNCSITGGYVYRGCAMPDMHGIYFYSDFCSSQMWSFRYVGGAVTEFATRTAELDPPGAQSIAGVSSFGEDAYGEVYILDYSGGEIFKILPADIANLDCDGNFVVDTCEIAVGAVNDCNGNGLSDVCDIADGTATDCNGNDIPDSCEIAAFDCNMNGIHDSCEIDAGQADDCNADDIPDECQLAANDCNGNGVLDVCDVVSGSLDCDSNFIPDECQLAAGTAEDCNGNSILDHCEIDGGIADDCDGDGRIDDCQIDEGSAPDCNGNGIIDSCDIAAGAPDIDGNGIPDTCEQTAFRRSDCNADGLYDLADPVTALDGLFAGGAPPTCVDACDANDDGSFDVADAVYTLSRLFSGGPDPLPPFPGCGIDLTPDGLECDQFGACP